MANSQLKAVVFAVLPWKADFKGSRTDPPSRFNIVGEDWLMVEGKSEDTIAEVLRRLVGYFHPERIYLFGSAARGTVGADSNLDFCVVLPDDAPKDLYRPRAYEALRGVPTAVDLVRFSSTDFDRRSAHVSASLPATVVREGKLLYDARTIAAWGFAPLASRSGTRSECGAGDSCCRAVKRALFEKHTTSGS
jgi:uncharacterized protein